jgi:HPt (histidine-containing phosphotransfer) domain-containing protein
LNEVSEINVEIGLSRVSGIDKMYKETVELFDKKLVTECDIMSADIHNGNLKGFSISVHAMKSALSTIGAMGLSETAAKLETASKDNDIEYCTEHFPTFKDKLLNLHEELSGVFSGSKTESIKKPGNRAHLQENINKALTSASDFDGDAGLEFINDLLAFDFGEQSNAVLENAAAAFRDFKYDAVTELLSSLKEN